MNDHQLNLAPYSAVETSPDGYDPNHAGLFDRTRKPKHRAESRAHPTYPD